MKKHSINACACGRATSTCRCTGPHDVKFTSTVCATCVPGVNAKVLGDMRVRLPQRSHMNGRSIRLDESEMTFGGFETEVEAAAARHAFNELLGFMGPMLSEDPFGRIGSDTSGDVIMLGTLQRADDGTFYFTVSVLE